MLLNNAKTVHPVNIKLFYRAKPNCMIPYMNGIILFGSKTGLAPVVYTGMHTVNLFKIINLVRHFNMSMKGSNIFMYALEQGKTFSQLICLKFLVSHPGDRLFPSPITNKKFSGPFPNIWEIIKSRREQRILVFSSNLRNWFMVFTGLSWYWTGFVEEFLCEKYLRA